MSGDDGGRYWRVGRKVGRTVYAQIGDEPSDEDILIGMFDTSALATTAADDHNRALFLRRGQEREEHARRARDAARTYVPKPPQAVRIPIEGD